MTKMLHQNMMNTQMGTLRTETKIYESETNGNTKIQTSEMKNLMSEFSGRLETAWENVSEFEYSPVEMTKPKE